VKAGYTTVDQATNYYFLFAKSDHQLPILYAKPNNYRYGFLNIRCNICSCYNWNAHSALSIIVMLRLWKFWSLFSWLISFGCKD